MFYCRVVVVLSGEGLSRIPPPHSVKVQSGMWGREIAGEGNQGADSEDAAAAAAVAICAAETHMLPTSFYSLGALRHRWKHID